MLANIVGKLGNKIIANKNHTNTHLFHDLQYGSRIGRSAMDSIIITISKAERAIHKGGGGRHCSPRPLPQRATNAGGKG